MRSLSFAVLLAVFWCIPAHAAGKIAVYASILPQQYFIERIGGNLVQASVMVMPGASPATYEPTPRQMAGLAQAAGYFAIGVPFERTWLARITAANASMEVVQTDAGVVKIPMSAHHDDHVGDAHQEGTADPHIWLAPKLVKVVAANTCAGLVLIDPANRAAYEANLATFKAEIDQLDSEIRAVLAEVPDNRRSFMVFHPSWGYFADQYGLREVAIESEGKEPGPRELVEIIKYGREQGVSVIFVQPQFSDRSAKVIATEIGARVVPLDPLALDWARNLRMAAMTFQQALR